MNLRQLENQDYPAIAAIHNSLNIVWPAWPREPEAWREADRNRDSRCKFQRWVAVEDGQVVGAASYANHLDDFHPQRFYINIEVFEPYRQRGIGGALYDQLMADLQPYRPWILRTDILANQIQSYPFVEKRGFKEVFRETPVHLKVASVDMRPYTAMEDNLRAEGIEIRTLRELESDPGRDRKAYDLYMALNRDVPGETAEVTPSPFEDWAKWCLNDPTTDLDAFFIAVHGDRYIALHELGADVGGVSLLGGLLGTLPEYRNKRIGLVLMGRAIHFAQTRQLADFKTCTAIVNAPMQALFTRMGFTRDPEWLQCEKVIPENA